MSTASTTEKFDRVIMACHTDQCRALLLDAHAQEHKVLSAIRYQMNTAYLHTDTRLMPLRKRVWSAWNYYGVSAAPDNTSPVAVTYWLNRLQSLPFTRDVFVTLNPPAAPATDQVIQRFDYAHPLLDDNAYKAQQQLIDIQGMDRVYFCGAWAGYGFHEDGLKAGMKVAQLLGSSIPWSAHYG